MFQKVTFIFRNSSGNKYDIYHLIYECVKLSSLVCIFFQRTKDQAVSFLISSVPLTVGTITHDAYSKIPRKHVFYFFLIIL